jgi:hypothetical protein
MAKPRRDEIGNLGELERLLELGPRLLVERGIPFELPRGVDGLGHARSVVERRGP